MNALIALSIVALVITINSCAAFLSAHKSAAHTSTARTTSTTITMSMWGAQKLGQSVIGTTTGSDKTSVDSTSWFRRAPVGSGCDDTTTSSDDDNSDDGESRKYKAMSAINVNFKQHSLMMELSGSRWGAAEKVQRIQQAAADGLFSSAPTLSLSSSTARPSNLQAGGLMNDWHFEM